MRMELIQPFINSADAVLAQVLQAPTSVADVSMDEERYRRKGVAAEVGIHGDIEGRVIFDLDHQTAVKVGEELGASAGADVEAFACETVCELANMVIGNAVTSLNDQGFQFKITPPEVRMLEEGYASSEEAEALVLEFRTDHGSLFMNIVMRHNRRRRAERESAAVA
jgi:chemotaxis protein CheX